MSMNRQLSKIDFTWRDDEVQLLMEAALELKSQSDYDGINWESKRNKYDQIKDTICERYPVDKDDEKYPHNLEVITRSLFLPFLFHVIAVER